MPNIFDSRTPGHEGGHARRSRLILRRCVVTVPKTIGILLFDGVEELDAVGPLEVLAGWTHARPEDGWQTLTVGVPGSGPFRGRHGLVMTPEVSAGQVGPIDVLVYPGGPGARGFVGDEEHLAWVRHLAAGCELVTSVCTGALVLASAGLLRRQPSRSGAVWPPPGPTPCRSPARARSHPRAHTCAWSVSTRR